MDFSVILERKNIKLCSGCQIRGKLDWQSNKARPALVCQINMRHLIGNTKNRFHRVFFHILLSPDIFLIFSFTKNPAIWAGF